MPKPTAAERQQDDEERQQDDEERQQDDEERCDCCGVGCDCADCEACTEETIAVAGDPTPPKPAKGTGRKARGNP